MKAYLAKYTESHVAKVFKNGSSQAVRLPKEYRLQGKTVAIYHLGEGVVLQPIKETWREIYNSMKGLSKEDFIIMNNAILEDLPPQERTEL
jgi:antitoxin VapB